MKNVIELIRQQEGRDGELKDWSRLFAVQTPTCISVAEGPLSRDFQSSKPAFEVPSRVSFDADSISLALYNEFYVTARKA